jgi:PAS domain S-box-containing protein
MGRRAEAIDVLHVDDDPDFLGAAVPLLERENDRLAVETAGSAGEALDRLDGTVDCVVSDYDMPGTDGIEFLRRVRERHGDLPFILFTGKGSEAVASDAVSAGVTDYLQKGPGTDQYALLANRVVNAVEAHRDRRRADRQERINGLIREITRRIATADTVEAIDRAVCEAISDSGPYRFAWIGEPDDDGEIVPRASAGDAAAYLEEVTVRHDGTTRGQGPGGRAVRTRERQVIRDIGSDPSFEPWAETAREHGFASVIVLPLLAEGTLDGILAVYAERPDAFEGTEQTVLEELAETVGGAIGATADRRRLRERETELRRYRRLVETVGDPMCVLDAEGRFETVNPAMAAYLGVDRGELPGREAGEFLDDADFERVNEALGAVVEDPDRGSTTLEVTVVATDGRRRPAEMNVAPLTGAESRGVACVIRDIAARKERERELRRYKQMVDAMQQSACIYDTEGRFVVVNEYLADFYGTTREELEGQESRLLPRLAAEGESGSDPFQELLDGEREVVRGEVEGAFSGRGQEVIEYWLTPLSVDGEIRGVVGVGHEVTERKSRERELKRYERMANAAGDMVYMLDTEGHFQFVNDTAETLTGYSRERLLGSHTSVIMEEEDIAAGRELIRELLRAEDRTRVSDAFSWTLHTADGATVPCESHITPLYDADGGWAGTVGVVRDISERVARERELERQNERLEEFASVVSHDLRNPLNVATTRLELAAEDCDSGHLDDVARAHDRMERLIADLLTLAREGDRISGIEPVSLAEVAKHCWKTVATSGASLRVEADRTVLADRGRLEQLFENLVRNAVEHGSTSPDSWGRQDTVEHGSTGSPSQPQENAGSTGASEPSVADAPEDAVEHSSTSPPSQAREDSAERGSAGSRIDSDDAVEHGSSPDSQAREVTVEVGPLEDGFYVADDGPGIPESEREAVFDVGYSTADDGTGLGLRIVRQIAEAHGWTVSVTESEAGGARFEFTGVDERWAGTE